MINWKGCGRKRSWSNFEVLEVVSRHSPGGSEENHENIVQDTRPLGRDLNVRPSEYEAGV
jgi:hypothetical protein